MKAIKRTVAALLATLMLATSTSFTLAAETYTDDEAVVVAKVNAAGIMQGTDKGFEPSKTLTRAEAAAIIVRMKGIKESAVKTAAGTTLFKDVAASHWASGYVNQASNLGIVKGVSATEFAPEREVTVAEFVTMAIRALGAGNAVDAEGTWPTNYVNFANENGLLDEVNAIYTAVSTRMNAATIVANTLESKTWAKTKVTSSSELTWEETNKTMLDTLNIEACESYFVRNIDTKERTVTVWYNYTDNNGDPQVYSKSVDVAEGANMAALKEGIEYDFYYDTKNKEVMGFWAAEDAEQDTVEFTKIVKDSVDGKVTLKVNGKDKEYEFVTGTNKVIVSYNETKTTMTSINMAGKNVSEVAAYTDADNVSGTIVLTDDKISAIYLEEFVNYGIVDDITSTRLKFKTSSDAVGTTVSGKTIALNNEDDEFVVTKDGKEIKVSDIEKDDVLFYYQTTVNGDRKYVINVVTESVKGEVTARTNGSKVYIDKVKYDTALNFDLEDEVVAYLNKAGHVCMYVVDEDSSAADVAIVKSIRTITGKYNQNYEIVLFEMDGTTTDTLTVDLEETYDEFNGDGAYDALPSTTADATAFADLQTRVNARGQVICYEISGNELIVKKADLSEPEYYYMDGTSDSLTIGNRTSYVTTDDADKASYYVDKDTKFFKLKADKSYSVKVEAIDYDDLDNTSFAAGSYISDLDRDEKYAGIVVFGLGTEVKRTSETNFGYIKSMTGAKYDGKVADLITVIYADGSTANLYTNSTITGTTDYAKVKVGVFGDITVIDEELVGFDTLVDADSYWENDELMPLANVANKADWYHQAIVSPATPSTVQALYVNNYIASKSELTLNGKAYTVSEDCLVLEQDDEKFGTYDVRTISDLEEYDAFADDNTVVTWFVSYKNDDGEEEIVFIVYQTIDTTDTQIVAMLNGVLASGYVASISSSDIIITGPKTALTGVTVNKTTKEFADITFVLTQNGDGSSADQIWKLVR